MTKKRVSVLLLVVLIFGTFSTVYAKPNLANGFHVANVYYKDANENQLVIDGYFYNVGNTPIGNFTDVYVEVYDKNQNLVANSTFNDQNLLDIYLKPGDSLKWTFFINQPYKNRDLSQTKSNTNFNFKYLQEIKLDKGIKIFYNSKQVKFDSVKPKIEKGVTLVPVRFLTEAMGAKVEWNESTSTVTIRRGNQNIKLKIGDKAAYVNGSKVYLDVPAKKINGRTMVPLRFVSETFGTCVFWGGNDQMIVIAE